MRRKLPSSDLPPHWHEETRFIAVPKTQEARFLRAYPQSKRLNLDLGEHAMTLFELGEDSESTTSEVSTFPVLSDEHGELAIMTDRLSVRFQRGTDPRTQAEVLAQYGMDLVEASRALPHKVIARARQGSTEGALKAARGLVKESVEVFPELITRGKKA